MPSDFPESWRKTSLGDVCSIAIGGTPSRAEPRYWSDGVNGLPWASIADLRSPRVCKTKEFLSTEGVKNSNVKLVRRGTVLMSFKLTIGRVSVAACDLYTNEAIAAFIPSEDVNSDFLPYWLGLLAKGAETDQAVKGATLNKQKLNALTGFLPPLGEQKRIAEILQSLDFVIEATERVVSQQEDIWHSLTENLIWKLVDTRPDCVRQLGHALITSDYGVNVPLTSEKLGMPVLRMGNIQNGQLDFDDLKWGVVSAQDALTLSLSEGDILFNRTNSRDLVGKVALVREETDCLYASYIVRLAVNRDIVDPYYLFSAMHSRRAQSLFKSIATPGVSQSNINPTNLKKQAIPLPNLEVQQAIAEQLLAVELSRLASERELKTLEILKQNVLADLLSGRKRVEGDDSNVAVTRVGKPVQPAFKRAVLAAEVVHQLHKDAKFGSIKHEKIVHLCEYHADLHRDIDRHAYKKAAGPYDPKARRSVEANFKSHKWFDVKGGRGERTEYIPMEKCGEHKQYFDRYFADQRRTIQAIIDLLRPLDSDRCQIIATLYAVWNDFLIEGVLPTDQEIAQGARKWHKKKEDIPEDRWIKALGWMRQKNLVPRGTGEKTRMAPA